MLLVACQKKNDQLDEVNVIGHAISGLYNYHSLFPENTQEALSYAFSFKELNGVEIDIQLSKDGTFWLFHDETLEERTNGKGYLCDESDEYIESLQYKGTSGATIPRLVELDFSHEFSHKKTVFIDLKSFCAAPSLTERLAQELNFLAQQWSAFVEFICIVNSEDMVEMLLIDYSIQLPFYRDITTKNEAIGLSENYSGIFIRNTQIERSDVQELQQLGLSVALFEVRAPASVRNALRKSPDYILPEDFKVALIEKARIQ
jgi:glycerophosphoryl diester phosphodiesterase